MKIQSLSSHPHVDRTVKFRSHKTFLELHGKTVPQHPPEQVNRNIKCLQTARLVKFKCPEAPRSKSEYKNIYFHLFFLNFTVASKIKELTCIMTERFNCWLDSTFKQKNVPGGLKDLYVLFVLGQWPTRPSQSASYFSRHLTEVCASQKSWLHPWNI